jgi:transcriptional regulator with XRE-family HTH domain
MIEHQPPPIVAVRPGSATNSSDGTFGEWLSAQLRSRKLTQRQLAQKSGVNHSTISRLVRGGRTPSLRTANLLAHALGVAVGVGAGSPGSPTARVEHALRLDDLLSEHQVREIMNTYLTARWRQRGRTLPEG